MNSWKILIVMALVAMVLVGGWALLPAEVEAAPSPTPIPPGGECPWQAFVQLADCETGNPIGQYYGDYSPSQSTCLNETLPDLLDLAASRGECVYSAVCRKNKWCK